MYRCSTVVLKAYWDGNMDRWMDGWITSDMKLFQSWLLPTLQLTVNKKATIGRDFFVIIAVIVMIMPVLYLCLFSLFWQLFPASLSFSPEFPQLWFSW